MKKPPIGIIPKLIHDRERFEELQAAIMRYLWDDREISVDSISQVAQAVGFIVEGKASEGELFRLTLTRNPRS